MKNLEIVSLQTGADQGFSEATGPTLDPWTLITFRVYRSFDWEKDGSGLGKVFRKVIESVSVESGKP